MPKGKLGIRLEMSDGPVVSSIKDGSWVKDIIKPGDRLITINGTDVREMPKDDVMALLFATEKKKRQLVVETTIIKHVQRLEVPPGKIGLGLKSTLEGPAIISVKEDGPLAKTVEIGDIIVAIDNFETKTMTAPEVRAILMYSTDKTREIAVETEWKSNASAPLPMQESDDNEAVEGGERHVAAEPRKGVSFSERNDTKTIERDEAFDEKKEGEYIDEASKPYVDKPTFDIEYDVPEGKLGLQMRAASVGSIIHNVSEG